MDVVLVPAKSSDGFTRYFRVLTLSLLHTTYKISPRIPNKHLSTPKRQKIIDYDKMEHLAPAEIKALTEVPTPTIRRTLRSGEARSNKNPTCGPPIKINERDLRHLIRAVTSSADGRRESYIKLAADITPSAPESRLPALYFVPETTRFLG